ncbi:antibiotic biosynthesis monooxygenase family protein [Amycolatopsis sacchari]|uniref:Heme-degrading monooxygenase HmoA n=1 Tax=Amycolatopsis sacchari TaxID=115433 RepID=A0A1I3V8N2_9PSEU|nr:antibiotic biosynthesis monooxygenase [Amycolatopsis sacchari]SFJ90481.1 Heme-degrading monooxygenase HmoA [Amycolatopsis sacchari]
MELGVGRFPEPPYYAVIFTSRFHDTGDDYEPTSERMLQLAAEQPGFLGVDSARGNDGLGITASYWRDEESIAAWRSHAEHTLARQTGRERWYAAFEVQVARVERSYGFRRNGRLQRP